MHKLQKAY